MHNLLTGCIRFIFFGALLFGFSAYPVFAQDRALQIIGTVESNMNPLPGAKVNLIKDGKSAD
ncbi:MAG: hypothetical protein PVF73_12005, partial [Bacteroidales bacterium]